MMKKKKLPEGIMFGRVNPYNLVPNITWDVYRLDSALCELGLMNSLRESAYAPLFSEFRKSSYFTPPTFDEAKDMNEVYRKVAIDFAKYLHDNYEE